MRLLLIILAIISSLSPSFAQKSEFPKPFEFKLIDSTEAGRPELYIRARAWIAKTFASSKDVIQMDDKEAGKLIAKATIPYPLKGPLGEAVCDEPVSFTLTIDLKDRKYRAVLTEFSHAGGYAAAAGKLPDGGSLDSDRPDGPGGFSGGVTRGQFRRVKEYAMSKAEEMLQSFNSAMKHDDNASGDGF